MKRKSKKIIIALCAVLMITTLGVGGYTYAKYTTQVKGNGQVDVAKWSFIVNDNSNQIETIKLTDTVDSKLLANGKIAPGTGGQFTIEIDGTGTEVGIDYKLEIKNEKNKPTNLTFTYEGNTYKSLKEMETVLKGSIAANDTTKIKIITIGWNWEYETGSATQISANDQIDTQEGIANLDYTFDIVVTGTQQPIINN